MGALNDGDGPDIFTLEISQSGTVANVVASLQGLDVLIAEGPVKILTYDHITQGDVLRGNPLEVSAVVSWGQGTLGVQGTDFTPECFDVPVQLTAERPGPGFHFFAPGRGVNYDAATGDASFTEPLYIEQGPESAGFPSNVSAFSMSLAHDSAVLQISAVQTGAALAAAGGGAGPEVFTVEVFDDGFTVEVIIVADPLGGIPAAGPLEMVIVDYETVPGALDSGQCTVLTPLTWAPLGTPSGVNSVAAEGETSTPMRVSGSILLLPQ